MPAARRIAALSLAAGLLALTGCVTVEPTGQTSLRQLDRCRSCPPGLFSGEDGVLTVIGGDVEVVDTN
jgi:hypothetical protein